MSQATGTTLPPDLRSPLDRLVNTFMKGPAAIMLLLAALAAGAVALQLTPREEEPQIVVPFADVFVSVPNKSAEFIERQVATRLEQLLAEIDGVEYVYSMSREGSALVTVRFYVGEDREDSLVKIYNKLFSNVDRVTPEVASWVVKPIEIDDVPIVNATLWSRVPERYTDFELRRIAEELEQRLQGLANTNIIDVHGGRHRQIRVEMDPEALDARRTTPLDVRNAIGDANTRRQAGELQRNDEVILVDTGDFLQTRRDVEGLIINVVDGVPVRLDDVATVIDGPAEPTTATCIGFGPADPNFESLPRPETGLFPAVSVSVSKKKGSNAVWVADRVVERIEQLKPVLIPDGVEVRITRNYGVTADEKVSELITGLGVAVLTVVLFVGALLGWRAAIVIAIAIPVCYGATLFINLFLGYTINRVTLFALILALGLLVDDPVVNVENIERHLRMGKGKPRHGVLRGVAEVRTALVMSTIAIIFSFVPLFFITGMMGPYMSPMAFNVPMTVVMSTVVAFCITPFLTFKALRGLWGKDDTGGDVSTTWLYKFYNFTLSPFLKSRALGFVFILGVIAVFLAVLILPMLRTVPLKMLPYDNKSEFQVIVDMPEGTTLERTDAVCREVAAYLTTVPEVVDVTTYAGMPSPMDFNGMIRHYYLRSEPHMGELRVNLVPKLERAHQSHEMILRLRNDLDDLGAQLGANLKLVEVPPGPPVLSTITVEIYGDDTTPYSSLEEAAERLAQRLAREPMIRDVDTSVEAPQLRLDYIPDEEKARISGIASTDINDTIALAVGGIAAGTLDDKNEAHPVPIILRLDLARRTDPATLDTLRLRGRPGIAKEREGAAVVDAPTPFVALGEIGQWRETQRESAIYHKNTRRVAYVYAEVAGRPPAEAILDVQADQKPDGPPVRGGDPADIVPLAERTYFNMGGGDPWNLPEGTEAVWTGEGEWKITIDAFRDLGIAFAVANIAIFLVLWFQTGSIPITLILMTATPLVMIGVMPGFWALNQIGATTIDGFGNPTFFTATAMIGMIALAGIVVRNSLVLVEFVHGELRAGTDLKEALIRAGAVRMRPILLTAGTTFLGNIVITLDPIFSGLAWAIIFGLVASTLFTLGVVPIVYNLIYKNADGHGLPKPAADEE
jgi:multidrug efflux pump subunit AcrB